MIKFLKNFDWTLFGGVAFLMAGGLVALASSDLILFKKQLVWVALALFIIFGGSLLNWRWLLRTPLSRHGLYWFSIALLIFSNLQSGTVRGTKSWLVFNGFQFEPAELTKIALIFVLAGFFSRRHIEAWLSKNIFVSLLYALIPASLVAIHPDFGSAIIITGIWIGFLLMSGINKKRMLVGAIIIFIAFLLLWSYFFKPYQKERLLGFLVPARDPLGINYNVIQSKIAIGSAGFWGKGFGQGTQTQLKFLPEAQTDFIFAALVEEWGIFGGLLITLAFLLLIWRISLIGQSAPNNEYKFIALGSELIFMIHFFINVGSNLGLVPVTGITLPFLSYGGSSLLTAAVLISIIEHIKIDSSF